jgi:hypothetical protein
VQGESDTFLYKNGQPAPPVLPARSRRDILQFRYNLLRPVAGSGLACIPVPGLQRGSRGSIPSPSGAGRAPPSQFWKNTRNRLSNGGFHAKYQSAPCRKGAGCGHGGRGVIPLPPLSLFFKRGSPPHPYAGASGGTPSGRGRALLSHCRKTTGNHP